MTIGILGLGLIGGSFARAYAKSGHTVYAANRSREMLDFAMLAGVVVDLDHKTICTAGCGGCRHGCHKLCFSGGMAGIDDDRQMGQLMEHGHGGQIQGVAGIIAVGTDAAFTQNHTLVAAGHDIFGAHEQLFQWAQLERKHLQLFQK